MAGAEEIWSTIWPAYCATTASSRRNATALVVLAIASGSLSVDFRCPCMDTSEKRIVAMCEHVIFGSVSDHCLCTRKLRASVAFFTTPGVFSMLVFICWSVGCVVGAFREGGLSDDFPLLVDGVAVVTFNIESTLLRGCKPSSESLEFF